MRIRRQPKEDRPDKPGLRNRLRRSRYAERPDPGPVKMITSGGDILGWEMPSGEFVPLGENCCENPLDCKRCFGSAVP
jgi:hypothetical protein